MYPSSFPPSAGARDCSASDASRLAYTCSTTGFSTSPCVAIWTLLARRQQPRFRFCPAARRPITRGGLRLGRAHWIILTRTELADAGGWQARVEAANPRAHIFHCSTRLAGLLEARRSAPVPAEDLRGRKVAAFCGIGNPAAFFADLRNWGFGVVAENAFPDHHAYRGEDLSRIAALAQSAGAEAILTTQKDLLNLPPRWDFPLPLFACCIQPEIEEKIEFERGLLTAVEAARRATG